jgi:hypothetical protein
MPKNNRRIDEDEEYHLEDDEKDDEKKFPVWIIPLVAGPVLLIILIVVLAGNQTGADTPVPERFDEEKLKKEASDFYSEAYKQYLEAMKHQNQRERDEVLDQAAAVCDKAIDKLNKIADYYDKNNIMPSEGGTWDWEKNLSDACILRGDISKSRGMTSGGGSQ